MTISYIIIAITLLSSFYAWKNHNIFHNWIFNPYQVSTNKQYYRFITSGFIHSSYTHLFFNMFTFYFFSRAIETTFNQLYGSLGIVYFLILYLVGIIVSDIPTFLRHRNNPGYNSLGASGGVSSIVFSYILFFPTQNLYLFALIPIPGFILGLLFVIYSYYKGNSTGDKINHDAHLYGALFGLVFTIIIEPNIISHFIDQLSNFSLF
jgi:membrane associated rhomboid family serine protease